MNLSRKINLSILDQSPVRKGGTAAQALQESVQLAKLADELGYTRYWVAEHHNSRGLAGSSPEVLIPYLACNTKRVRIGSGGVMLPHYSTLKVAENFKILENLFPGRIDLGIGRAPGTDRVTASVLNPYNQFSEDDFLKQLKDLGLYLNDTFEAGDITVKVRATPTTTTVPPVWLLSSSGQSGLFAAHFGYNFSFAHFINPVKGHQAVKEYKQNFVKSEFSEKPEANVGVFVMCAETEKKAQELQETMDLMMLRIEKGINVSVPPYEDVQKQRYSEEEQLRIQYNRQRMISGTPDQVKERLLNLAEVYDVDELIIVTITFCFEDRKRSYQLLADAFDLH